MPAPNTLRRYWREWQPKLESLVSDKGAKLYFPIALQDETSLDGKTATLRPKHPVCISNAPEKASSRRAGRQLVLIDGSFDVHLTDKVPQMVSSTCNVTIFKYDEVPSRSLKLELVESMHFDMELPFGEEDCRDFHPIFHAQRGESLTQARCRDVLKDVFHLPPENIEFGEVNKAIFGNPYLRLPTPQLDLFSVMTIVAADFFCNGGDADRDREADAAAKASRKGLGASRYDRSHVLERFVSLLQLLRKEDNVARAGSSSQALFSRIQQADHMSAGHWYPEWDCQAAA